MNTASQKPIIAISSGDPGGIGPEITVAALMEKEVRGACTPVIVGSVALVERALSALGKKMTVRALEKPEDASGDSETIEVIPFGELDVAQCPFGKITAAGGRYSGDTVLHAVELAKAGRVYGVVISPNNKQAMRDGGHQHTGMADIARHYVGGDGLIQILMGKQNIMARVTNHVPLRKVADHCTREKVLACIRNLHGSLAAVGLTNPVIGVSGLNPHCGEDGLIGTEEITDIGPACDDARAEGLKVIGPIPPDTVFNDIQKLKLDAVLSMYHDHGNSGIKILEFGDVVNFMGGLSFPMFTVAHGTAYDLAGKGIADATNMRLSILRAAQTRRLDRL